LSTKTPLKAQLSITGLRFWNSDQAPNYRRCDWHGWSPISGTPVWGGRPCQSWRWGTA